MTEMIHDVRVIPLEARPHLPSNVHQWLGDSRGIGRRYAGGRYDKLQTAKLMGVSSEKLHVD